MLMWEALSVKNSRACPITSQSTQLGGRAVASKEARAEGGSCSGSLSPVVVKNRIRVLRSPTSPRRNISATVSSASGSPWVRRASSAAWS